MGLEDLNTVASAVFVMRPLIYPKWEIATTVVAFSTGRAAAAGAHGRIGATIAAAMKMMITTNPHIKEM